MGGVDLEKPTRRLPQGCKGEVKVAWPGVQCKCQEVLGVERHFVGAAGRAQRGAE